MKRFAICAAVAMTFAFIQAWAAGASDLTAYQRMEWVALRTNAPDAAALRKLWRDKLDGAQQQWASAASESRTLPAYALVQTFAAAHPPVLVSLLFDMYDCDLPGNGAAADLYARCPMRILVGSSDARIKTIDRVCLLYVPPADRTANGALQGPDPQQNRTLVAVDANRTLHLRVVQFGQQVPACDADIRLQQ